MQLFEFINHIKHNSVYVNIRGFKTDDIYAACSIGVLKNLNVYNSVRNNEIIKVIPSGKDLFVIYIDELGDELFFGSESYKDTVGKQIEALKLNIENAKLKQEIKNIESNVKIVLSHYYNNECDAISTLAILNEMFH